MVLVKTLWQAYVGWETGFFVTLSGLVFQKRDGVISAPMAVLAEACCCTMMGISTVYGRRYAGILKGMGQRAV